MDRLNLSQGTALLAPVAVALSLWAGGETARELHRPDFGDGRAEVLFVGTSRTRDGILTGDARQGRVVRSLVFPCLDLPTAITAIRSHRARFPELEDLVLEVSDFSLLADIVEKDETALPDLCAALDLDSPALPSHGSAARAGELWLRALRGDGLVANHPTRRINLRIQTASEERERAEQQRERRRRILQQRMERSEDRAAETRVRYARGLFADETRAGLAVRELAALVESLGNEGVRVWCLVPPLSEAYRKARPDAWTSTVDEAIATARSFRSMEHRILDLRASAVFGSEDFFDVDHLNESGARKLTEHVLRAIEPDADPSYAAPR